MGTWGVGPFANDEALDFLDEIEAAAEADRLGALARPIDHVAFSGDYLEAPTMTEAVAAAAVVGAVLNPGAARGEPYLPEWVGRVSSTHLDNELVERARKALRRAMQPEDNELHELWAEAGAAHEWRADLSRVLAWLGDRDD